MADAAPSAEQVAAAIGTLLAPGVDSAQQRQADAWLSSFSSTRAAWDVALTLLGHPQTEVAYFAACMLQTKVRREWRSLAPDERGALSGAVSGALAPAAARPLVAQRLCLVLAAAGARATPADAVQFAQQALALGGAGGGSLPLALTLLQALAEEANDVAPARRTPLVAPLSHALADVLALCDRALAAGASRADVLRCALSWLRLHPDALSGSTGGSLLASPPLFASAAPSLYTAAVASLAADDEAEATAATDLLVELQSGGNAMEGTPEEEAAAAAQLVAALLALTPKVVAPDGEGVARTIARVATSMAERHMPQLCAGEGQWLHLVQLMLGAIAARPECTCLDACTDFFLAINSMPSAERHPSLREPLFSALLSSCLAHAALPATWRSWADAGAGDDEEDADTVQRMRQTALPDLFEASYTVLRAPYLATLAEGLQPGAPWPHAEAALLALRCAAIPLRERALEDRAADAVLPGVPADREATSAFLVQLFGRIAGEDPVFSSHPLVVEATCDTLGIYAAWLGRSPAARPVVRGCTAYLLRALGVPGALPHAADALRNICSRCTAVLSEPATLSSLITTAHACLPPPPPPPPAGADPGPDERATVVEGLARLVGALPPAEASGAALALTAPIVARAGAAAAAAEGATPAAAHALAAELFLLASAVRFLPVSEEAAAASAQQPPPVLAVLQAAWPVLAGVGDSGAWRACAPVVAALADVFARAFLSAKAAGAPLLPPALRTLLGAFEEHGHASALDALATAVEIFAPPTPREAAAGARHDPAVDTALAETLERAARGGAALVQARGAAAAPDTLRALFELAHRAALFAPPLLLRAPTIEPLMALAVEGIRLREREPCRAAAQLLHALLSPGRQMASWGDAWRGVRPALDAAMGRYGAALVGALAAGGAATAPRSVTPALGGVLHALLCAYPAAAPQWLAAAVMAPDFPAAANAAAAAAAGGAGGDGVAAAGAAGPSPLGDSEKSAFLQAALRSPPLPQPRFEALFADMSKVCRREESGDALLAYSL